MTENGIRLGGIQTFWSLAEWNDLAAITAGLKDAGLEEFTPEPRTAPAALRDALEVLFNGRKQLVRPMASREAFAVVEESRAEATGTNNYVQICSAHVDENLTVSINPYSQETGERLVAEFNHQLGMLRAAQVAAMLVSYMGALKGVSLRKTGGFYWLPNNRVDEWRGMAAVVERAGLSGKSVTNASSKVYVLRTIMDADAIRAVCDAVTTEITATSSRIYDEVVAGDLGDRALKHRKEEAEGLREKIELYENLLSVPLDHLKVAVEKAGMAAGAAALMESAVT